MSTAAKSAVVALAADAFFNSKKPRFRGKAMRVRAIGYTVVLFIVPVVWRLRGRPEPYPHEVDLLATLPVLVDAAGNATGLYQGAHVDDAVHFGNGALISGVIGSLIQPRTRTAWEAATFATSMTMAAEAAWEIFEWTAMKLGSKRMDLTYDDTIEDLIETSAGALLGGIVTLLRHPAQLRRFPGRAGDPILDR